MARIAIVGAHGKIAQHLLSVLYDRGDETVGIVRNPDHAEDVYRLGGEGVVLDIESAAEDELARAFEGVDAVVFSAGAGPGSSAERKRTVDFAGSVLSAKAAARAGVRRFVQVSSYGADDPVTGGDEVWAAYVAAKRDADAALRESGLDWTILRPGALTNDEGTGAVSLANHVERGSIPRQDVATLIARVIDEPRAAGQTWEVVSGDVPIDEAVRSAVGDNPSAP